MPSPTPATVHAPKNPQARLVVGDYSYTLHLGRFLRAHASQLRDDGSTNWAEINGPAPSPDTRRALDQAFTRVLSQDTEESLVDEYTEWCTAAGLPLISADEQDLETMSPEQRHYVNGFILRWERAIGQQAGDGDCLSYEAWGRGVLVPAAS